MKKTQQSRIVKKDKTKPATRRPAKTVANSIAKTKAKAKTIGTTYKIPSDGDVLAAMYSALGRLRTVDSQHRLKEIVQKELALINPAYRIAPKRLRLLAIKSGYVTLEIRTAEEEKMPKRLKNCPVCGFRLKSLKNRTIYGGKITLGYSCKRCSYWTGLKYQRPVRYIFTKNRMRKSDNSVKLDNGLLLSTQ